MCPSASRITMAASAQHHFRLTAHRQIGRASCRERELLFSLVHSPPSAHGINRTSLPLKQGGAAEQRRKPNLERFHSSDHDLSRKPFSAPILIHSPCHTSYVPIGKPYHHGSLRSAPLSSDRSSADRKSVV